MTDTLNIPFARFQVGLELESDKPVSRFLEATLRGGFGYTLRALVCMTRAQSCGNCLFGRSCAYRFLFETPPPGDAPRMRSYRAIPRPFTFRASQSGSSLAVQLTLFGGALGFLPYFVYTFDKLGRKGLGGNGVRFRVREVLHKERVVYPLNGTVACDVLPDNLVLRPGKPGQGSVSLLFETPLLMRKGGQFLHRFDSRVFFSTLLRRITNLNAFFGKDKSALTDPDVYLAPARDLEVRSLMEIRERSRFSTRQKKRLDYSGLVGEVVLTGETGTLFPLLRAGELTGVGKNTAFGGGVYRMRIMKGSADSVSVKEAVAA
ncbi:MAG: CRISPR system precrRNA processing endoribonuclease RAMP protein Cas6 [Chitinispirillaceae bacterium]